MSISAADLLESLGLSGMSPARAVVEFSRRDVGLFTVYHIYRECAGPDAPEVPDNIIHAVAGYFIEAAAKGVHLSPAEAIRRAEALRAKFPASFTDATLRERAALRIAEGKDKAPVAVTVEDAPVVAGEPRKRGRPPSGEKSAYEKAADLWRAAADRSKAGFIAFLQSELGIGFGSAQTYYYKAKKEIPVDAVAEV